MVRAPAACAPWGVHHLGCKPAAPSAPRAPLPVLQTPPFVPSAPPSPLIRLWGAPPSVHAQPVAVASSPPLARLLVHPFASLGTMECPPPASLAGLALQVLPWGPPAPPRAWRAPWDTMPLLGLPPVPSAPGGLSAPLVPPPPPSAALATTPVARGSLMQGPASYAQLGVLAVGGACLSAPLGNSLALMAARCALFALGEPSLIFQAPPSACLAPLPLDTPVLPGPPVPVVPFAPAGFTAPAPVRLLSPAALGLA